MMDESFEEDEVPLKYRRRRTTRLRPVFPRFDWMICPNVLAYLMSWYGLFIGKFPAQVMCLTCGLSCIFCAGMARITPTELNPDDFLPTDSPSTNERSKTLMFDFSFSDAPSDYPTIIRPPPPPNMKIPVPVFTGAPITTTINNRTNKSATTLAPTYIERRKRDTIQSADGQSSLCRVNAMLIVAKTNNSDPMKKSYNLFEKSMLKRVQELEDLIYDLPIELHSSSGAGGVYTYESRNGERLKGVCTVNPSNGDCAGFTLGVMRGLFRSQSDGKDPLDLVFSRIPGVGLTWPHYHTYDLSQFFGKVETVGDKPNGQVKHIGAMREVFCLNTYFSDDYFANYVKIWEYWERKFDQTLRDFKSPYFNVYWSCEFQKQAEQNELIMNMLPKLLMTFVALMIWCGVGALMGDSVRAKPWVGVIGVMSTLIACAAGFGICLWLDPGFKSILMAVPLLTLAIGLDDMFIMLEAWSETNPTLPVEERMMLSMNTGGTSIVITFFINLLDFVVGNYTPFPVIQMLSTYAIATMVYDFICQMTIFAPCLVLFGRNEYQHKHSCCCCVRLPSREKAMMTSSECGLLCCAGGYFDKNVGEETKLIEKKEDNSIRTKDEDSVVVKALVWFLTSLSMRIISIGIFCVYVSIAVWSITQMELGLRAERVYRSHSNLYAYTQQQRILFTGYGKEVQVVITNELDYSSPAVRQRIFDIIDKVETSGYFWNGDETKCWVRDFVTWADADHVNLTSLTTNQGVLYEIRRLHGFLDSADPTSFESYGVNSRDIRMDKNGTTITKTRLRFRAKEMTGPTRQRGMLQTIRGILSWYNPYFVMFAYMDEFPLYDQFLSAVPTTLYYCSMTLGVTVGVALFMIPHPACLFWVALFVTTVLLGIVGLMRLWDMDLDSVSLINLLIAISFCSDLIAHPVYIFMVSPADDEKGRKLTGVKARVEKAKAVVREVLGAAIPACVGTTLSVIAMSTSDAYIFITFFRVMFLSVVLSILHALLFIPAFLSFIGPSDTRLQEAVATGEGGSTVSESVATSSRSEEYYDITPNDNVLHKRQQSLPWRTVKTQPPHISRKNSARSSSSEEYSARFAAGGSGESGKVLYQGPMIERPSTKGPSRSNVEVFKRPVHLPRRISNNPNVELHPMSERWTYKRVFRMRGGLNALKDAAQRQQRRQSAIIGPHDEMGDYRSQLPPTIEVLPAKRNTVKMPSTVSSPRKQSSTTATLVANSSQQNLASKRRAFAPPVTSEITNRLRRWQPPAVLVATPTAPLNRKVFIKTPFGNTLPKTNANNSTPVRTVSASLMNSRLGAEMLPARHRFNM